MKVHEVNWESLESYDSGKRKSLEELWYQIVSEEYREYINDGARLVSVDDSGGGDGVEFYLLFPDGKVWGWQTKLIERWEDPQRQQIKKSLYRAYEVHGDNLDKWFLCTMSNRTPDEDSWFNKLPSLKHKGKRLLPVDHHVTIDHWGETATLNFLRKYPGIHNYFFSGHALTPDWFTEHYDRLISSSRIKARYNPLLHIQTTAEMPVDEVLGGNRFAMTFDEEMEQNQVAMYAQEYTEAMQKLFSSDVDQEYKDIHAAIKDFSKGKLTLIDDGIQKLQKLKDLAVEDIGNDVLIQLKKAEFEQYIAELDDYLADYDEAIDACAGSRLRDVEYDDSIDVSSMTKTEIRDENNKRKKARDILFGAFYALSSYAVDSLKFVYGIFRTIDQHELHISGAAGMGKTHLSFDVYRDCIERGVPAVFLSGKSLTSLQDVCGVLGDLPAAWTLDDFLGALNTAGAVRNCKVPFIIDGLNESEAWRTAWNDNLEALVIKIEKQYPYVVLLSTYRSSYQDQIFPKGYFRQENRSRNRAFATGFNLLTEEATAKYFDYYKIILSSPSQNISEFSNPLYLRMFCEIKNGDRKEERRVSLHDEDLFDIFDQYLSESNARITTELQGLDPKYDKRFVTTMLSAVAECMWNSNTHSIPFSSFPITPEQLRAFEGEDLLLFREYVDDDEGIQFTYDLLGGYIIARWLLSSKSDIRAFVATAEFTEKLVNVSTAHPLYNDILRCFSVLVIKEHGLLLSDLLGGPVAARYALKAAFEVDAKYTAQDITRFKELARKEYFASSDKSAFYLQARQTAFQQDHPLNFMFWSELLTEQSMVERDLSWGEYVRTNAAYCRHLASVLYELAQSGDLGPPRHTLLVKCVFWMLTTTNRRLRDEATRALYWYGRCKPDEFMELVGESLAINDPYVSERMLAACYGIVMARSHDPAGGFTFRNEHLPAIARKLYNWIFDSSAPFATTHILARDYAKRTIDLALASNLELAHDIDLKKSTYPLKDYPHRTWGESQDKDARKYSEGNAPIQMDFANYTIGGLVHNRRNYDNQNEEYKTVLGQVYWRMYDLGYTLKAFGDIDQIISRDNWRMQEEYEGKVDRYGKKYSWIAYYELAGRLSDESRLKGFDDLDEVRIADVDIDPSFPVDLKEATFPNQLERTVLLGSPAEQHEAWYTRSTGLDCTGMLSMRHAFDDAEDEWILLKAEVIYKDAKNKKRDVYSNIEAVIVSDTELKGLKEAQHAKEYSFHPLRSPDYYYVYAGELPWSDLVSDNSPDSGTITYTLANGSQRSLTLDIEHIAIESAWEPYHSEIIPTGQMIVPCKQLCRHLRLHLMPQTSDLYDEHGQLVTTSFAAVDEAGARSTYMYIRRSKLEQYLKDTGKKLAWLQWSEKQYFKHGIENYSHNEGDSDYKDFCTIYTRQ